MLSTWFAAAQRSCGCFQFKNKTKESTCMTCIWMLCSYDVTYAIVFCTDDRKTHRGNSGSSCCSSGFRQKTYVSKILCTSALFHTGRAIHVVCVGYAYSHIGLVIGLFRKSPQYLRFPQHEFILSSAQAWSQKVRPFRLFAGFPCTQPVRHDLRRRLSLRPASMRLAGCS